MKMIMKSRPSRKNESLWSEEITRRKCSGKEVIFEHSSINKQKLAAPNIREPNLSKELDFKLLELH